MSAEEGFVLHNEDKSYLWHIKPPQSELEVVTFAVLKLASERPDHFGSAVEMKRIARQGPINEDLVGFPGDAYGDEFYIVMRPRLNPMSNMRDLATLAFVRVPGIRLQYNIRGSAEQCLSWRPDWRLNEHTGIDLLEDHDPSMQFSAEYKAAHWLTANLFDGALPDLGKL